MSEELEKIESNDNLFPFTINKDIDIWLPLDKRITFQKSFSYLRKKLQIKQTRKTYIDSILKKCKARFFKAINDCLKQCVKIHIKKLPQAFITNISIEYNKSIMELTVEEINKIFNLSDISFDTCINEKFCYKGKENYLKYLCKSKISDLYLLYIQSKRYKREVLYIKNNVGFKMFLLYLFVSENYVNYYLFSKPHFCKNLKRKKLLNKNKNDNEKITICHNNNNTIYCESKKSTIFSVIIDESENNISN